MSAGQNARRYGYTLTTMKTAKPTPRRAEAAFGPSLVLAATALLVIAIVANDPVLSAAVGNLWADATRELMRLILRFV